MNFYHTPILADTIIDYLNIKHDSVIADLTVGEGGHSSLIAPLIPDGQLICLDRDPDILKMAKQRLTSYQNITYICDTYDHISEKREDLGLPLFNGIIVDMGVSMFHFKGANRGFSFKDDLLDMRLNNTQLITAQNVINTYSADNLADIFFYYGEERHSRTIAKAIVRERPFLSAKNLAHFISTKFNYGKKIHPATKIFQGLRIYVNKELEIAEKFMQGVLDNLAPEGVLCVLTFHSLEDRIVKKSFQLHVLNKKGVLLSKKPITPSSDETKKNVAARSAKLRIIKRIL